MAHILETLLWSFLAILLTGYLWFNYTGKNGAQVLLNSLFAIAIVMFFLSLAGLISYWLM